MKVADSTPSSREICGADIHPPMHGGIRITLVLLLLVMLGSGLIAIRRAKLPYYAQMRFGFVFFEKAPPKITLSAPVAGIGLSPQTLEFDVNDTGAGIDEVVVRIEQNNKSQDILKKSYPWFQNADHLSILIDGKKLKLSEGNFRIHFKVFDKAFWSNGAKESFELPVDFTKPKLTVLSTQHNTILGGSSLVMYQTNEKDIIESGVQLRGQRFKGVQARLLDARYEAFPDVYATFIAIPLDFNRDADKIRAYALDRVSNVGLAGFYYRVRNIRAADRQLNIERTFLDFQLRDQIMKYQEFLQSTSKDAPIYSSEAGNLQEATERLKTAFGPISKWSRAESIKKAGASAEQRLWENPFIRQPGTATTIAFGTPRTFVLEGTQIGTFFSEGTALASHPGMQVVSANAGKIVWAGELGVYGTCVIVDHGIGLSTLYGHLSQTNRTAGETVQKGDALGTTGYSGLSEGDNVYFEIRVQGQSVNPVEWWDRTWVRAHIEDKLNEVLSLLQPEGADVTSIEANSSTSSEPEKN